MARTSLPAMGYVVASCRSRGQPRRSPEAATKTCDLPTKYAGVARKECNC